MFNERIRTIEVLKETKMESDSKSSKYSVLDVIAKVNGEYVHLEMQNTVDENFNKRVDYYGNTIVTHCVPLGTMYKDIARIRTIWIMGENIDKSNIYIDQIDKNFRYRKKRLNGINEIYIIELLKFMEKDIDLDNKLSQWLYFLGAERIDEKMNKIMRKNKMISKAVREECTFTDEDQKFFDNFRRQEAERLYNEDILNAEEKGMKQGMKQGVKQGIRKGIKNGIIKVICNMYRQQFDILQISNVSGMSQQEVENILKQRRYM